MTEFKTTLAGVKAQNAADLQAKIDAERAAERTVLLNQLVGLQGRVGDKLAEVKAQKQALKSVKEDIAAVEDQAVSNEELAQLVMEAQLALGDVSNPFELLFGRGFPARNFTIDLSGIRPRGDLNIPR